MALQDAVFIREAAEGGGGDQENRKQASVTRRTGSEVAVRTSCLFGCFGDG